MDTRVTHHMKHGVIVGQWWRRKDGTLRKHIKHMTKKGEVCLDMPPKMPADWYTTIDDLIENWELVKPVELRPYTQPDGIERIQILERDRDWKYPFRERFIHTVIGELGDAMDD